MANYLLHEAVGKWSLEMVLFVTAKVFITTELQLESKEVKVGPENSNLTKSSLYLKILMIS